MKWTGAGLGVAEKGGRGAQAPIPARLACPSMKQSMTTAVHAGAGKGGLEAKIDLAGKMRRFGAAPRAGEHSSARLAAKMLCLNA